MTPTEQFIERLEALGEGERSQLRRLVGRPLDETVPGFDLFTGLWWPLRQQSQKAPQRETSWLIAKLYGAFPIPHVRRDGVALTLARTLGGAEPRDEYGQKRHRCRFDALLQAQSSGLEPHLGWGLSVVAEAIGTGRYPGLDWAQLLDDLSPWDRGDEHRRRRDIRDIWAEQYLNATHQPEWRS